MVRKTTRCAAMVAGLVVAGAWLCGPAMAQDESGMDMAAIMAAAEPNEHHQRLEEVVGTWKAAGKFYNPMAPDAPPTESNGTATNKMVLGGRFLMTEFEGDFMGMPFKGLGMEGYDNSLERHVATWVDSMGTMIMQSEGECSQNGKVKTLVAEFKDPATGQMTTMRQVTTIQAENKHVFEMFTTLPDGADFKVMEIIYTR